jgi:hypothetical protein
MIINIIGGEMIEIHADLAKNWFYITLSGKFNAVEANQIADKTVAEAKKLKPGFGTISDISQFIPADEETRTILQNTMVKVKNLGMGHVVRITGKENFISANQWQRSSRGVGYTASEAPNREEAEKLLARIEKN